MAATDTTREEQHVELARRVAEEAWGGGDYTAVDEGMADDVVVYNTAAPEPIDGVEAYKAFIEEFRTAVPDLVVTVEDILVDGDEVAMRFSTAGTHEGPLMGIEPTGRTFEGSGLVIARFEGDEAVEVWEYGDQARLLQQLGVIELPGT